jgi:hypothetical protein
MFSKRTRLLAAMALQLRIVGLAPEVTLSVGYLSPCTSSCLFRPSKETQAVLRLSGEIEIWKRIKSALLGIHGEGPTQRGLTFPLVGIHRRRRRMMSSSEYTIEIYEVEVECIYACRMNKTAKKRRCYHQPTRLNQPVYSIQKYY